MFLFDYHYSSSYYHYHYSSSSYHYHYSSSSYHYHYSSSSYHYHYPSSSYHFGPDHNDKHDADAPTDALRGQIRCVPVDDRGAIQLQKDKLRASRCGGSAGVG